MNKHLKFAFFAVLLTGAGYFFGIICRQINQSCNLIFSPSTELLHLLLWLFAALGAIALTAGIVATLVRPLWIVILIFTLSGVAMLLGWQVSVSNSVLILVYISVASFYAYNIARGLNERITFSVHPISESQGMLLMGLILVACGGLYFGCSTHIEREGFVIPESYMQMFVGPMREQVLAQMPEAERGQTQAEFEEHFQNMMDHLFEETVKPYEQYIPLAIAVGLFFTLQTAASLVSWIPSFLLSGIFPLLKTLKVTTVVIETEEVQRLIVE